MFQDLNRIFPTKGLPFSILYHPDCDLHDTGLNHPERSQRLRAIIEGCLDIKDKAAIDFQYPAPATITDLTILHPEDYLMKLEEACLRQSSYFMSPDNPICFVSFKAILAAGGVALELGRRLLKGKGGFALTRPPGHHAGINRSEGFCFLNHVGLAIEEIRRSDPNCRILIVDFDVHHGNGTCDIYCKDKNILFLSIHGPPTQLFPGTGSPRSRGEGAGLGYTINVPLPMGTKGDIWIKALSSNLKNSVVLCRPNFLLVSAGFDAHKEDSFALMEVEDNHYLEAISILIDVTQQYCPGRIGFVLEGGYSIEVLKRLVPKIIVDLSSHYNSSSE